MRWWVITGYGLSAVVHFGLAAGVTSIPKQTTHKATAVTVFEAKPKKEKPKEPEEEGEAPRAPQAGERPQTDAQGRRRATAGSQQHAPATGEHCSDRRGARGFGCHARLRHRHGWGSCRWWHRRAHGRSGRPCRWRRVEQKKVRALAPKPSDNGDGCVEEPTKPKSVDRAQPQYTDEARSANVEGVVSVEFNIAADGQVIDARIVRGLGHGLDQAALAAAKRWKFNPAMKCGKPVESKHIVNMRFQLGD